MGLHGWFRPFILGVGQIAAQIKPSSIDKERNGSYVGSKKCLLSPKSTDKLPVHFFLLDISLFSLLSSLFLLWPAIVHFWISQWIVESWLRKERLSSSYLMFPGKDRSWSGRKEQSWLVLSVVDKGGVGGGTRAIHIPFLPNRESSSKTIYSTLPIFNQWLTKETNCFHFNKDIFCHQSDSRIFIWCQNQRRK